MARAWSRYCEADGYGLKVLLKWGQTVGRTERQAKVGWGGDQVLRAQSMWHSPLVGPFVLEARSLHQLIGLCGAWATTDVGDGLGILAIDLVQQWGKDVPGLLKLVTAHKVHLASTEDVQDEACSYASKSFTFLYLLL